MKKYAVLFATSDGDGNPNLKGLSIEHHYDDYKKALKQAKLMVGKQNYRHVYILALTDTLEPEPLKIKRCRVGRG